MALGGDAVSWPKIVLITVLVGCVVGLKFVE
jgi:multidrug transporter EmrE-like cation transporter